MSRARDAGKKKKAKLNVEPLFNGFSRNVCDLDEDPRGERGRDKLPRAFNPEMNNPPPIVPVDAKIRVERQVEEIHDGEKNQAAEKRSLHDRPASGLKNSHSHIEQKD